jgi:hypothetical protein
VLVGYGYTDLIGGIMNLSTSSAKLIAASRAKPERLTAGARPAGQISPAESSSIEGAEARDCLTLAMLRTSEVPAHFVFAYHKTGLLVTEETKYRFSGTELMCWDAAVLEYFRNERKNKAGAESAAVH